MSERFLEGRVAMVTGGASGIGRAIALALASAGADVAIGSLLSGRQKANGELMFLPSDAQLEDARRAVAAHGSRCLAMELDVTCDASVQAWFDATLSELGPVDILANAAGITVEQTVSDHPDDSWHKVIDVNLNGTFRTIKRALPGMIERGWGRIINIASTSASVGAVTGGAYSASKSGVVGLTRCVALEGAPHGVTCNAISPTWVDTSFGRDWMSAIATNEEKSGTAEYLSEVKAANPQGRLIDPSEVGALALFLCREEARGMTMQDLPLSAGSLW
jgi:NAD(P)-dependent dehydrogenase (short-subunit alcohol dehydrogenase family)